MARPPRIEIAGGVFHVTARGNERQPVYRDDRDRERFLDLLSAVVRRYRWRVLSYCLMGNHYHLLVQTLDPNLARGMRQLNGVYAQWFNHRHCRVGHLFQGRYAAVLVQHDAHLLAAVRYIVRNPVRAGMTRDVGQWRWTSHAAILGAAQAGPVAISELLALLGPDQSSARASYLELVGDELLQALADAPRHPLVFGDEEFVVGHLSLVRPSPEHPRASVRPSPPALSELVAGDADVRGIAIAHRRHGYSLRQIATHLGCGVTTIHRRIRAYEAAETAIEESSRTISPTTGAGETRKT